ncbi:hypothetical protein [Tenacibaculum crassostreae]|uniref:hypothetical protein n=1 Tax=Tenacibaculum crassostreae TaxID=502683 RepID=UPI0038945DFA
MRFLKTYFFFFFVFSLTSIFSQSLGDFRSVNDGLWTNPASWEYFNGSTWVSPPANTNYPGDGVVTANDVVIANGTNISLGSNIAGAINSVTIGDETGTAVIETLTITNTSFLNTTNFTIAYDGLLFFSANKTFSLPAGTNFIVESPNPDGLVLGTDHGLYTQYASCSASKTIKIGSSEYATCNGGGGGSSGNETFDQVNNSGGNLTVSPTYTAPPCINQTLNLFANPGGTEHDASTTFSWTVTPPVGAVYMLSGENPTDTPTTTGIYIYEVTATSGSISNTNSVSVEIISCNKTVITNRRITYRVKK